MVFGAKKKHQKSTSKRGGSPSDMALLKGAPIVFDALKPGTLPSTSNLGLLWQAAWGITRRGVLIPFDT